MTALLSQDHPFVKTSPGAEAIFHCRARQAMHPFTQSRESMEEYYALLIKSYWASAEHLPTLRRLAGQCDTVAELGTYDGNSAFAMMMGEPKKMVSVDIIDCRFQHHLEAVAEFFDIDLVTLRGDSRIADIGPVDMLYIDSEHTYRQVYDELKQHIDNVGKYLVFHDTCSFPKIRQAIHEVADKDFELIESYINNYGLWVMKRRPSD